MVASQCRPRMQAEAPDSYPFTGDDGDADAIRIVLRIQETILDRIPPEHSSKAFGEFMSHEDILSITVLNHITAYLDNREEYAKMADEVRGYLVIE